MTLSRPLADRLGIGVGDSIEVGTPLRTLRVVGIVDAAVALGHSEVMVAVADPLAASGHPHVLVDLPAGYDRWHPDSTSGLGYASRSDVEPSTAEQLTRAAALTMITAFALVQIGLLAAAGFAVSARRQRRDLALLGSIGATRRQLQYVLLVQGGLLGAAAGVVGVGLALAVYWPASNALERLVNHPLTGGGLPYLQLALLAGGAVAVGLLASAVSVLASRRKPIKILLSEREPAAPKRTLRITGTALSFAALGAVIVIYASQSSVGSVVMASVGAAVVLLSLAACGPALVTLVGRRIGRAPLGVRYAVRHAVRYQVRTGVAVAAVCAAMAGSTALMLYLSADTAVGAARQQAARTGQVIVPQKAALLLTEQDLHALRQRMPIGAVTTMRSATATPLADLGQVPPDDQSLDYPTTVAVGGAELVRAVTGHDATPAVLDALADGRAIVFYPVFIQGSQVTLVDGSTNVQLPATYVPTDQVYRNLPGVLIAPAAASAHGLTTQDAGVVLETLRTPKSEELAEATSVMLGLQAQAGYDAPVPLIVGRPDGADTRTDPLVYVLAVVSMLVTVTASTVAVGLARTELRGDLATFAAIGATPRLERWIPAFQAGLIVGLGGFTGAVAGIALAAALVALRPATTWHIAWGPLTLVILGAPIVAVLLAASSRPPSLRLTHRLT